MSDTVSYTAFERGLHRFAFAATGAQLGLADFEDGRYRDRLQGIEIDRPVFITSLPRAGTTLLLETLCATDEFASHTYRDMPFVLCPMIWDRLSRGFRQNEKRRERAHGDGMEIGFDSPEALEEVIWKRFWSEKYSGNSIAPWSATDEEAEFDAFLRRHIIKIIALRGAADTAQPRRRYISKNNANIARIGFLAERFPTARFLVPFRKPADHISSLMRQHKRFSELHAHDRFARDYMGWLGHFEFGQLLKPINFDGWLAGDCDHEGDKSAFWAQYWLAAYSHLLSLPTGSIDLVDYDQLCRTPEDGLARIAARLEITTSEPLTSQAGNLRAPSVYDSTGLDLEVDMIAALDDMHKRLVSRAI